MANKEKLYANYGRKVLKGNRGSLKGKKEVPNWSAMEAADDCGTQEIKSDSYFLLSIIYNFICLSYFSVL